MNTEDNKATYTILEENALSNSGRGTMDAAVRASLSQSQRSSTHKFDPNESIEQQHDPLLVTEKHSRRFLDEGTASKLSSEKSESAMNTDVLLSSGAVDMTNLRRKMSNGEKIKRMIMSHNGKRKKSIKKAPEL